MDVDNVSALVPVLSGHEPDLRRAIEALPTGDRSPFAAVPGTHVARLVVLESFGGPADSPRRLHPPLLALSALVDGPFDAWLRSMCTVLGSTGDGLWCHCAGWPAEAPSITGTWLHTFRIRMHVSLVGNPGVSVDDVHAALQRRSDLLDLALEAGRLSPGELRHRYVATFGRAEAVRA
jgi:hypothetical protein